MLSPILVVRGEIPLDTQKARNQILRGPPKSWRGVKLGSSLGAMKPPRVGGVARGGEPLSRGPILLGEGVIGDFRGSLEGSN